ncbi:ribonuclease P protein component [Denitratisoma sp. agr-D3]
MAVDNRFRPVHRLHQASEFSAVFQNRRVIRGKFFDLHWRPCAAAAGDSCVPMLPRLGLVVPKRLARRAVLRNLMKRIAREAFRRSLADLPQMDLVLRLARGPGKEGKSLSSRPGDPELRLALAEDVMALLQALPRSGGGEPKPAERVSDAS